MNIQQLTCTLQIRDEKPGSSTSLKRFGPLSGKVYKKGVLFRVLEAGNRFTEKLG